MTLEEVSQESLAHSTSTTTITTKTDTASSTIAEAPSISTPIPISTPTVMLSVSSHIGSDSTFDVASVATTVSTGALLPPPLLGGAVQTPPQFEILRYPLPAIDEKAKEEKEEEKKRVLPSKLIEFKRPSVPTPSPSSRQSAADLLRDVL
jgi:hypothetical protein